MLALCQHGNDSRLQAVGKVVRSYQYMGYYNIYMRSRGPLFAFLLLAGVATLPHFAHASIPFFGPVVPDTGNLCALAWGMVITVVNNLIELGITLAIVFVAPIMIAYAGFLMVIEPMSPGGHTKARGILLNTVVGIVIALAAWLIVDAVMAALTPNGRPFGENWATIISSNGAPQCINIPATLNQTPGGGGEYDACRTAYL